MLPPLRKQKFTIYRMMFDQDSQFRGYNSEFSYSGSDLTKYLRKYHTNFGTGKLVFSILESMRTGSSVPDHSGNGRDFIVHGWDGNSIPDSFLSGWNDGRGDGDEPGIIGSRKNGLEPFPILRVDSSLNSFLQLSGSGLGFDDSFTFRMSLIHTGAGISRDILFQDQRIEIGITAGNKAFIKLYLGGAWSAVLENAKPLNDGIEHHVYWQYDKTGNSMHVQVDDVSANSSVSGAIGTASNDIFLFSGDGVSGSFDGYAHSCFLTQEYLDSTKISALESQIESFGYEVNEYSYTDGVLTSATVKNPYYPHIVQQTFGYSGGNLNTISEVLS